LRILGIIALVIIGSGRRPSSLANIAPAPPTILVDSEGKAFDLGALKGKVVLVSFVYTTCSGTCPATTATLVRVQRSLEMAKLWGKSVAFVSITLDPTRDSPEALRAYAKLFRASDPSWHFLTGTPAQVDSVIKAWGMWAKIGAGGVIDHPSRIFLLDRQGREREIYNLEFLTLDSVLSDIQELLEEAP
jgi:protein SCO1/2